MQVKCTKKVHFMSKDNGFSVGVLEIQASLYQHMLISVFHTSVENYCVILFLSFLACVSEDGNHVGFQAALVVQ